MSASFALILVPLTRGASRRCQTDCPASAQGAQRARVPSEWVSTSFRGGTKLRATGQIHHRPLSNGIRRVGERRKRALCPDERKRLASPLAGNLSRAGRRPQARRAIVARRPATFRFNAGIVTMATCRLCDRQSALGAIRGKLSRPGWLPGAFGPFRSQVGPGPRPWSVASQTCARIDPTRRGAEVGLTFVRSPPTPGGTLPRRSPTARRRPGWRGSPI